MPRFLIFMIVPLLASVAWGQSRKMTGDNLSNMIIEGENRLGVKGAPPSFEWTPDLYREVGATILKDTVASTLQVPAVKDPPLTLPEKSESQVPAVPWLRRIETSPLLTLRLSKTEEDDSRRVEWQLAIRDSGGSIFHQEKKRGVIPEELTWDGFGARRRPLHVGADYNFAVFIIDEAGNPQRHAGDPFNVKAFRYQRGRTETTLIAPEEVFKDRSSIVLSPSGRDYLTEVRDALRLRYGRQVQIRVADDDEKFATARANRLRDFIVESLTWPADKVSAVGVRKDAKEGYRHVEITSR